MEKKTSMQVSELSRSMPAPVLRTSNSHFDRPTLINDGERKIVIDLSKISYIKADHHCCHLYSRENRKVCIVNHTLGKLDEILPSCIFVKVNRSYLINVWEVDFFLGNKIIMKNNHEILLSPKHSDLIASHFAELRGKTFG